MPLAGMAQIVMSGIPSDAPSQKSIPGAGRTKAISLPFWEDFSQTRTAEPDKKKWFAGTRVRVNNAMAINPPSIGVATFDGVDSLGAPYKVNDVLAKGYADKLESTPIDLTVVAASERNSVYLSYAYQMKGRGETPDNGDRLLVSFKDKDKAWVAVDTIDNDGNLLTDVFYSSFIQVNDERFYHDAFQFRIQNFSRLSGAYDTWNVDYIYLNKGRSLSDTNFPDRTLSESFTNLFGPYRIMPISHFRLDSTKSIPSVIGTNLRFDPTQPSQPLDFSTTSQLTYWTGQNKATLAPVVLQRNAEIDDGFIPGVYKKVSIGVLPNVLPPATLLADSIQVDMMLWIDADDNVPISAGDYDPARYAPIDFRNNDTTRVSYLLSKKYAYDDGGAEYAAGLNQPGASLAYEYNLIGKKEEFVTHLEMYFPRFGDETSQVIELTIWNNLADPPLYTQTARLERTTRNKFWTVKLDKEIPVNQKFFIGWKQNSSASIAVGLDKNTDTGDKMYYNTNGEWVQNTFIHGSLMFRPVIGAGTVGLEEEPALLTVYPNPSNGTFRFGGAADQVKVYDMTGRSTDAAFETTQEETIVTLHNASTGIYIIKAWIEGAIRTSKVMVR